MRRVSVAVPIDMPGNDWAVLVSGPETTAFGPNRMLIERALLALVGTVVICLLLSLLLGEWLTRPFRAAHQPGQGAQHRRGRTRPRTGRPERRRHASAAPSARWPIGSAPRSATPKSAREEIARQAERLRDLLRRTVRLQEDERRRIATDIHDAVSPLITGALYQAQAVRIARSD